MPSPRLFAAALCLILTGAVHGQPALQTPDAFLGYALGTRFTPHYRVMDYVEHVAAASPNVELQPYGETYEGRPLVTLAIALPDHLAQLETIRTDHLKRAGLMEGAPSGTTPPLAVVWLGYNVHGNESVSTEAAMQTLYDLANPADARTQGWLEHTVVILDPCLNPDGRDRYVHWYNRTVGRFPNADPDAREHDEPWPGGRTNHYYFDLNRDWAWTTQQEVRARVANYRRWMPHVHVDFHEQGVDQPYYFAPAAEPFHEAITPWQRTFQTRIGENHARYFDAEGWLYFTRQVFDLLYPGYGDTWPTFNGAIGMTYEQGGSGRAGLGIRTAEGDTLTLRDRIAHHYTTGLSTVEVTAEHAGEVVDQFVQYYEQARTEPQGPYQTYVVRRAGGADRLAALTEHLDRQGLAYGYAAARRTARGFGYLAGAEGEVVIEPGDLILSAYQPHSTLLKVLFEPQTALPDSLTYDITAWALPYVYGLDAYALPERIDPGSDTPPAPSTPAVADLDRPYAYLIPWTSFEDARFLASLLQEDLKIRFAGRPFTTGGRTFGAGTLIVSRTGNDALDDRFDALVREAAATYGRTLYPVATGFVETGADFGSSDVPFLEQPRVAVLTGPPTSSYGSGQVWHFFDQQLGYPVTLLNAEAFGSIDLSSYDVLVLPDGAYGSVLTGERLTDVRAWVGGGGRLIALERAAGFLAGAEGFDLNTKPDSSKSDSLLHRDKQYGERERLALSESVPGAVYEIRLDPTHPLAFGYSNTYFTLKQDDTAFAYLEGDANWNVGVVLEGGHRSGFVGAAIRDRLEESLALGVQHMGQGEVVYFIDDPLFRAFWYNGRLLFSNAVFMAM